MATYKNKRDLTGHSLREGDFIFFSFRGGEYRYEVLSNHLSLRNHGGVNDTIFGRLELNKYSFCDNSYRYENGGGSWPTFCSGDFGAAKRVVWNLFEEIEKRESPQKKLSRKESFRTEAGYLKAGTPVIWKGKKAEILQVDADDSSQPYKVGFEDGSSEWLTCSKEELFALTELSSSLEEAHIVAVKKEKKSKKFYNPEI